MADPAPGCASLGSDWRGGRSMRSTMHAGCGTSRCRLRVAMHASPETISVSMTATSFASAAAWRAWRDAHRWHPNQLRHIAGTLIRKQFNLEAARAVLGHHSAAVTEVYLVSFFSCTENRVSEVLCRFLLAVRRKLGPTVVRQIPRTGLGTSLLRLSVQSTGDTREVYAEMDSALAASVISKVGQGT